MLKNPTSDKSATDVAGKSLTEEFMAACYEFRRNVLSDKYEMREVTEPSAEAEEAALPETPWRTVTRESINTIARRTKRELGKKFGSKASIEEYIYSEETPDYDPIAEYLSKLPAWDGQDRERDLFLRLSGVSEVQIAQLSVWLRSCVAHWLQLDHLHGNEQILTLIGPQGCGKSTYCAQLLPEPLRMYFLDHVNLANKFDKDMALTNNLLVNIDDLDQIKEQNVKFQHVDDLESMLIACFRRPEAEEIVRPLMTSEVVDILAKSFPGMKVNAGMNVKVGRLLSTLNFERKVVAKGTVYYIVPMKKSA